MPLKKSEGNMYRGWVTHTHSHLTGACGHSCSYCYVQAMAKRFPNMAKRYSGDVALDEKEFKVVYPEGKIIFVEHMNDLFAESVPDEMIERVMDHCSTADSVFVFQTKNPERIGDFISLLPKKVILGTTLETNRYLPEIMGSAPRPRNRASGIGYLSRVKGLPTFITCEPLLAFDLFVFLDWIFDAKPSFVNIGADSKGHGLPEPTKGMIEGLIAGLQAANIEVRQKDNLGRLLK